jgi:hypothetical protein
VLRIRNDSTAIVAQRGSAKCKSGGRLWPRLQELEQQERQAEVGSWSGRLSHFADCAEGMHGMRRMSAGGMTMSPDTPEAASHQNTPEQIWANN